MHEPSEEFNINVAHSDNNANIQQESHTHNENNSYIQNYSLPGIIHFLEHQWRKFEIERSQWEIEKAELQSKISFLQGERRGQENLKKDMIRRIKMLEYALKQERAKHKNVINDESKDDSLELDEDFILDQLDDKDHLADLQWKQGRHLLKQYLQEIGYADTVIDARTQRARTLLGFSSNNYVYNNSMENNSLPTEMLAKNLSTSESSSHIQSVEKPGIYDSNKSCPLPNMIHNQNSCIDSWEIDHSHQNYDDLNFKSDQFYSNENFSNDRSNYLSNLQKPVQDTNKNHNASDSFVPKAAPPYSSILKKHHHVQQLQGAEVGGHVGQDTETEEALSEFDFLSTTNNAKGYNDNLDDTVMNDAQADHEPTYANAIPEQYHNGPATKRLVNSKGLYREVKQGTSGPHYTKPFYAMSNNMEISGAIDKDDDEMGGYAETDRSTAVLNNVLGLLSDKNVGGAKFNSLDNAKAGNCTGKFSGLGDLADISVSNGEDTQAIDADVKISKTWNTKLTLKGHLDAVRCVVFHPTLPLILSASEDQEIKLWNLEKNLSSKKLSSDIEAIATFRKHSGPVLCIGFSGSGDFFASGGIDASVYCWKLPNIDADQFETLNETAFPVQPWAACKGAHTDAIWAVKIHPVTQRVFSASADGSVVVWEALPPCTADEPLPGTAGKLLARIYPPHVASKCVNGRADQTDPSPPHDPSPAETDPATCMDFTLSNDYGQLVVSYASSTIAFFDVNTYQPLLSFKPEPSLDLSPDSIYINYVISHPTRPVTIVAHDDKCIRFFDNTTGKCLHNMVAHLDAVSCLAIDPYGLYLLSGSHDTSIRLWDYEHKTCVQEITCHRKKYDEAVNTVAFHPTLSYIASGGADGIIKVYV